jgi:hypothetical protein
MVSYFPRIRLFAKDVNVLPIIFYRLTSTFWRYGRYSAVSVEGPITQNLDFIRLPMVKLEFVVLKKVGYERLDLSRAHNRWLARVHHYGVSLGLNIDRAFLRDLTTGRNDY